MIDFYPKFMFFIKDYLLKGKTDKFQLFFWTAYVINKARKGGALKCKRLYF